MDKFGVQLALEGIAEARSEWGKAKSKFDRQVDWMMERLLNEAAANMMSADQVAKASGLTTKRIRALMRKVGLDPRNGKKLLAHTAAEALASNAEIMGVEPHEIDLMSPLAYLPMGKELREKFLETKPEQELTAIEALTEAADEAEEYCHLNHEDLCSCFTVIKQLRNRIATLEGRS